VRDAGIALFLSGILKIPPKYSIELAMSAGHGLQEARIDYGAHKNMDEAIKVGTSSALSMGVGLAVGMNIIPPVIQKLGGKYMQTFWGKGLTGGSSFLGWDATQKMIDNGMKKFQDIEVLPEDEYNMYDALTSFGLGASLGLIGGGAMYLWQKGRGAMVNRATGKVVNQTFEQINDSIAPQFSEEAMGILDPKQSQNALRSIKKNIGDGELTRDAVIKEFNNFDKQFRTRENLQKILDIVGE
jgi:hypothetical protein